MDRNDTIYLVHIHEPDMDYYALRNFMEDAEEEVFIHVLTCRSRLFTTPAPTAKADAVREYYKESKESYFHIVDIECDGNIIMEGTGNVRR